jgi:DNA-binding MarR family transcriptional regulator
MPERQRVAELVERLSRIAHTLQFADGLNPAQWAALRYLARANRYSLTPGALAEFLGTTKGTASQTLIALESKGLIRRLRTARDRRSVTIELTDEGRATLGRDPVRHIVAASGRVSADDQRAVAEGMDLLLSALQQDRGRACFGYCDKCDHLRVLAEDADGKRNACGMTGDELPTDELTRLCVNFKLSG